MRAPVDLVNSAHVVVPKKRPPNMGLDLEFFAASTPYGASSRPAGALEGPKLPYKRLVQQTAKKSVARFQKKMRSIKGAKATRVLRQSEGGAAMDGAPGGVTALDALGASTSTDGARSVSQPQHHATPHLALYHKWEQDLDAMDLGSLGGGAESGGRSSTMRGGGTFRAPMRASGTRAASKSKAPSPKRQRAVGGGAKGATQPAPSQRRGSTLRGAAQTTMSPRLRAAAEQSNKLSDFWERHPQLERLHGEAQPSAATKKSAAAASGGARRSAKRKQSAAAQRKQKPKHRRGAAEVQLSAEMAQTVRSYISERLHGEEVDEAALLAVDSGRAPSLVGLSVASNGTLRQRNPIAVGFSTGSAALLRQTRGAGGDAPGDPARSAGAAAAEAARTQRSLAALRRTTRAALGADDFWGDEISSPLAAPLDARALCHRSKRARQIERLDANVAPAFSLATLVRGGRSGEGIGAGIVGELGLFPYSAEAHAQASVIQREWRRVLSVSEGAAVAVQRRMRGILQRRRTLHQIASLTSRLLVIQGLVRGHLGRRWIVRMAAEQEYHAAMRTQSNFRGFRVRLKNKRDRVQLELDSSTNVQCAFRSFTARRRVQRVRLAMLHAMATHVQRAARGLAGRNFAHAMRVRKYAAATLFQALVRGVQGKQKAAEWREHYYNTAASRLQTQHREHYTETTVRALFRSIGAVAAAEEERALRETRAVEAWVVSKMEAELQLWKKPKGWAKVRRKRKELAKARKKERGVVKFMTAEQKRRRRVAQLFNYYDVDGSGMIDRRELGLILSSLGARASSSELDFYMMQIDADGSGEIDMDEFYNWCVDAPRAASSRCLRAGAGAEPRRERSLSPPALTRAFSARPPPSLLPATHSGSPLSSAQRRRRLSARSCDALRPATWRAKWGAASRPPSARASAASRASPSSATRFRWRARRPLRSTVRRTALRE